MREIEEVLDEIDRVKNALDSDKKLIRALTIHNVTREKTLNRLYTELEGLQ